MFDNIRKIIFFNRVERLMNEGFDEGKITDFDDGIYDDMKDVIISSLPVSISIKYSKYLFPTGTCYDRSLYMFFALDDATIVRGNLKSLELTCGQEAAGHGWIERGDYVYDPSMMLRFDKDLYYRLYCPSDLLKVDKDSYFESEENRQFYNSVVSTSLDDYREGGSRRLDALLYIFQVKSLADLLDDEEFRCDLDEYLQAVDYDPTQIGACVDDAIKTGVQMTKKMN